MEAIAPYGFHLNAAMGLLGNRCISLRCLGIQSVGDCLRECDDMRSAAKIHNGDLIVVTGPLVSNHDIGTTLAQHKATKKTDKSTIMTLSLKRLSPSHRTRSSADRTIW